MFFRCYTKNRMQRLLWSPEYESYINLGSDDEPIVLVESPFVVESKTDDVDKMVYVCLTTESLLIGEENLTAKHVGGRSLTFYEQADMTTACRTNRSSSAEGDWDLQDFRLKYLFPLQHVRLSIRQYREKQGEHVLRLRVGEGGHPKTWYLELAGRHREVIWNWWKEWIEELEKRRNESRHRLRVSKKKLKYSSFNDSTNYFGELNLDWHRDNHGLRLSQSSIPTKIKCSKIDDDSDPDPVEFEKQSLERREKLRAWHIDQHKTRITAKQPGRTSSLFSHKETQCLRTALSVLNTKGQSPVLASTEHSMVNSEEPNSCSSVEDIMSVGSLVDSDVDWRHAVSDKTNDRLVLCTGGLFGKCNVETHGHGHKGRARPMASGTALSHLLEFEDTNLAIDDKHHTFVGIDTEELHHTHSVPDILEGEAAFLEDDREAATTNHCDRVLLAILRYQNLNQDNELLTRMINGHPLLLTKEELRLEEELLKFREGPHDLNFTTCKHKGKAMKIGGAGEAGIVQKCMNKDIKKKRTEISTNDMYFSDPIVLLTDDIPWWADIPAHIFNTSTEIPPEAMARELTLIDKELFVMIHESELINCMWLKHDKHSKAPNVLKAIEFFERVVRIVSSDILKRNYDWARAKTMAYFTEVAEKCLELQNFHSLKAILCGMQVPAIYRLKHSWADFQKFHPDQYSLFTNLAHLMTNEGCSDDYFARLKTAKSHPPYLPFLGAFLKSLISMFTVKDEGGMRTQHRSEATELNADDPNVFCHSENDEDDSSTDTSDEEVETDNICDKYANLFKKVNTEKTYSVIHRHHPCQVEKSPAYLMNETLFHYQIAAIQYKWTDLPPVREFWLRNEVADEVNIWKKSCEKENGSQNCPNKVVRLAEKERVKKTFTKRRETFRARERL